MGKADAYRPASSARRSPVPSPHRFVRARHPGAPQQPGPVLKPRPSPGGSRSSALPVACSAPGYSPPISRHSLSPFVDSARLLHQLRPASPTRVKPHHQAKPASVPPGHCLPHAPAPVECDPSPVRRRLQSPVREPFLWTARLWAPAAAGSPQLVQLRFLRRPVWRILRHCNRPAIPMKRSKRPQVNNPTTKSSLQFLRRIGSQYPLRVKQFGIGHGVTVDGMPITRLALPLGILIPKQIGDSSKPRAIAILQDAKTLSRLVHRSARYLELQRSSLLTNVRAA